MELNEEPKQLFIRTEAALRGSVRRVFMAGVVQVLGKGGQRQAETELGWNRGAIRKGQHELASGVACVDDFAARGRKRAEEHWPNLLTDIQALADAQSQALAQLVNGHPGARGCAEPDRSDLCDDPLVYRLTAAEIGRQLELQKGYRAEEVPSAETLRVKTNQLDYRLHTVQKSRPKKKRPKTDALFAQLTQLHTEAHADSHILRLSLDAKATIGLGPFSRHGQTRVQVRALDHDFRPDQTVTPWGSFLPEYNGVYLYFTPSAVTADFIADCLQDFWTTQRARFPHVTTWLINQDNGPQNHSRCTQSMKRMTELADHFQITLQLAYYPPYHSKYNPIERVWGSWNSIRMGVCWTPWIRCSNLPRQ